MNFYSNLAVLLTIILLLGACANQTASNAANSVNQKLIETGSPYRWQSENVSGGTMMTKVLVGTPGSTVADDVLQRDIVAQIAAATNSGVDPSDRPKEVRIISQSNVAAEEIWIFEGSEKDLVYVINLSSSNAGGTDMKITGPW